MPQDKALQAPFGAHDDKNRQRKPEPHHEERMAGEKTPLMENHLMCSDKEKCRKTQGQKINGVMQETDGEGHAWPE